MPHPPRLPEGVGQTAFGVARARAAESRRPDRLFEDPLAQAFAHAGAEAGFAERQQPEAEGFDVRAMLGAYVAVRTRFFDDALLTATQQDGIRQVVILGAGLDARAFRLPWPEATRLFEVDTPEVIAFKEHVLRAESAAPACAREVIAIDLREDWPSALREHGFEASQPSAWLLEGLLTYLSEPEREALLVRLGELCTPGSHIALEPPGWTIPPDLAEQVARGVLDRQTIARTMALRQAAASEPSVAEPGEWLSRFGWHPTVYDVAERFAAYNRAPAPSAVGSRRWLVSATR